MYMIKLYDFYKFYSKFLSITIMIFSRVEVNMSKINKVPTYNRKKTFGKVSFR